MLLKKYKISMCINTLSSNQGRLFAKRLINRAYKCDLCVLYSKRLNGRFCSRYIDDKTLTSVFTLCSWKCREVGYQYIPTRFTPLIDYC